MTAVRRRTAAVLLALVVLLAGEARCTLPDPNGPDSWRYSAEGSIR